MKGARYLTILNILCLSGGYMGAETLDLGAIQKKIDVLSQMIGSSDRIFRKLGSDAKKIKDTSKAIESYIASTDDTEKYIAGKGQKPRATPDSKRRKDEAAYLKGLVLDLVAGLEKAFPALKDSSALAQEKVDMIPVDKIIGRQTYKNWNSIKNDQLRNFTSDETKKRVEDIESFAQAAQARCKAQECKDKFVALAELASVILSAIGQIKSELQAVPMIRK